MKKIKKIEKDKFLVAIFTFFFFAAALEAKSQINECELSLRTLGNSVSRDDEKQPLEGAWAQ